MSRMLIDRNSATDRRSSQTSMCRHCDGCLTARSSKLNGQFSRAVDAGLQTVACRNRATGLPSKRVVAIDPAGGERPFLGTSNLATLDALAAA